MTESRIRERASELLGRDLSAEFVDSVLWGDPFIYGRRLEEDPEAVNAVLGVATGRLAESATA